MKEAKLYEKLQDEKVKCTACKQGCLIPEGKTGICSVRINHKGKLYLMVYGKAGALNIDPIEKKPLYHFLPGTKVFSFGTVGCNFSCGFCQNWDLSQVTKDIKKRLTREQKEHDIEAKVSGMGHELPPERIVQICKEKNIPSIAYTYNEPIIFAEYIYDTAKLAKDEGIKNVLVSNGYETDDALQLLKPYVDAINVDLKAFTEEFYRKLCHARLHHVLDTIRKVHDLGIWMEITTLIIPGQNDSPQELQNIAEFIASVDRNIPWHVSAFYPQYKMNDTQPTESAKLFEAHDIGKAAGLKYVYTGNIPEDDYSSTSCPACNELLIKRTAFGSQNLGVKNGRCSKCDEPIHGVWS